MTGLLNSGGDWFAWFVLPGLFIVLVIIWTLLCLYVFNRYKDIELKFNREKAGSDHLAGVEAQLSDLEAKKTALEKTNTELENRVLELKKSYTEAAANNEYFNQLREQLINLEADYNARLTDLEGKIKQKEEELEKLVLT